MSFDSIISNETLELKSTNVTIDGKDGKKYKFSVTELSPHEMARCLDEFLDVDFLAVIYRSVRDEDGARMTKEQAGRLPSDVTAKFIQAYNSLLPDIKKKSIKKTKKKTKL